MHSLKGRTYIQCFRCDSSGTLAKNPTHGHLIKRVNGVNFCREKQTLSNSLSLLSCLSLLNIFLSHTITTTNLLRQFSSSNPP